ncbi:hypothetical protein [Pseudotabrizicola sediminis]|nr:hypothetical protein [Pseudotabrizicola sediminis]
MSYRTYIATTRAAYIAGIEAGISPQELRAHTGVIGEAFVADYLGVKLSTQNNEHGYDLMDPDGLKVSVKTITTSTGVHLNEKTIHLVDRVIIVWINTQADLLDVIVVYDRSIDEFKEDCAQPYLGKLRLQRSAMTFPSTTVTEGKFEVGDVVKIYQEGEVIIRKHSSGSFTALVNGLPKPARPYLMAMRDSKGLPNKSTDTTRSLGAQVFANLEK